MARKRRDDVVAAFQASGLSQAEFCRRKGVASSVLHCHLKRTEAKSDGFAPVGRTSFAFQSVSSMWKRASLWTASLSFLKVKNWDASEWH